ncbi:2-hydroxyacyl-CoA dehydratase subunit D [Paenibacillus zanthoxyli]|uniref:2-hydroxyacyl-CoA dehydratase subunit D n=1 Tax=Paenibacillus zanthoxyli TaxID=369399 RepID=UPI00046F93C5|nr:2-hydroxyacyl-CoA dehydratase family protein [Paenibacillus zanthoxyli]
MIEQAEIFALMNRNRAEFVKSAGRPAIGWLSIYTPEEILDAAGLVPFRITGEFAQNTSEAGSMLCSNFCSYLLHSLSEGIEGIYDFADGMVIVDECDWRKRLYEAWKKQLNPPFTYFLELPKVITPESKAYFRLQLKKWVAALESHYQIQITGEALRRSISLHNETRTLLQRLYKLRQSDRSPVTGMEALQIMKAATAGRKEEFNRELARFLDDVEARNEPQAKPHRVLVCGSYFDQPELVEIIEQTGARIVCEDTSIGIKYAEGRIEENEDPLTAIADYYLEKATCARMYDSDIRLNHLLDLIETYKADSVIYFTLKFCDIYLMDYPYVMSRLQQQGISVLFIEGEQQMSNIQSIKTRVQTFLETRMF